MNNNEYAIFAYYVVPLLKRSVRNTQFYGPVEGLSNIHWIS